MKCAIWAHRSQIIPRVLPIRWSEFVWKWIESANRTSHKKSQSAQWNVEKKRNGNFLNAFRRRGRRGAIEIFLIKIGSGCSQKRRRFAAFYLCLSRVGFFNLGSFTAVDKSTVNGSLLCIMATVDQRVPFSRRIFIKIMRIDGHVRWSIVHSPETNKNRLKYYDLCANDRIVVHSFGRRLVAPEWYDK